MAETSVVFEQEFRRIFYNEFGTPTSQENPKTTKKVSKNQRGLRKASQRLSTAKYDFCPAFIRKWKWFRNGPKTVPTMEPKSNLKITRVCPPKNRKSQKEWGNRNNRNKTRTLSVSGCRQTWGTWREILNSPALGPVRIRSVECLVIGIGNWMLGNWYW